MGENDNIDMEKDDSEDEGDIDKRSERTNSKVDTRKERYFIYKKGTKTYREAIPFKDSIMRDDEVEDETDDPRKEEKLKENMSQEKILGGESLFNRVYQGITGLSNVVTSGFSSLKKTVSDISGNIKKMTRVEEDQAKDIEIEEEMNMKKLERKVITSKKEVRKDLNQNYVKSEVKLRDKIKFDPFSISGVILISMLLGTVEAGKITSSNELYKSDSSWIDRKTNTEKYEDLVIQAYDCLEENQLSTTLSLKAPMKCKVSDGSAYCQSKLTNAQVLE